MTFLFSVAVLRKFLDSRDHLTLPVAVALVSGFLGLPTVYPDGTDVFLLQQVEM